MLIEKANWHVVKAKKVWGVAERHRNTIVKVERGDSLVMYCKQERIGDELVPSRIAAVFEAATEVFADSTKIFNVPGGMGNETFPLRIKLKPVEIFRKLVAFKPLIPQVSFVKNKKKWSGYLMSKAMRPIPKEDFAVIKSAGEK